jgi:hypothetical protein
VQKGCCLHEIQTLGESDEVEVEVEADTRSASKERVWVERYSMTVLRSKEQVRRRSNPKLVMLGSRLGNGDGDELTSPVD